MLHALSTFAARRAARLTLGVICLAVAGCSDATAPVGPPASGTPIGGAAGPEVVLVWNEALLDAIRSGPIGPPIAARALAIVHTGMYDAWAAYDAQAVGTRLGGALRRPSAERTPGNRRQAVSFAAHRTLLDLFPARAAEFDRTLRGLGYDPGNQSTDPATPAGVGNRAAAALLEFRHRDGSNQLRGYADDTGYRPVNTPDQVNDPNRWQPLRLPDGQGGWTVQQFVAPHWYRVVPFALTSGSQFRPAEAPPLYGSEAYRRETEAVVKVTATLTDRQKAIAEYWADGPRSELPPGHWNLFARWIVERDRLGFDDAVKLFFALNNAIFDAGIVAWDAKRAYDYVRPVTAVRVLYAGQRIPGWPRAGASAADSLDGAAWMPYQPVAVLTPPFAECISGHSTFSAAAEQVLRRFTGSDRFGYSVTIAAGSSRVEPGRSPAQAVTLRWESFGDAAREAGMSRLYGGIHFPIGNTEGLVAGRQAGVQSWEKALTYWTGTASI